MFQIRTHPALSVERWGGGHRHTTFNDLWRDRPTSIYHVGRPVTGALKAAPQACPPSQSVGPMPVRPIRLLAKPSDRGSNRVFTTAATILGYDEPPGSYAVGTLLLRVDQFGYRESRLPASRIGTQAISVL